MKNLTLRGRIIVALTHVLLPGVILCAEWTRVSVHLAWSRAVAAFEHHSSEDDSPWMLLFLLASPYLLLEVLAAALVPLLSLVTVCIGYLLGVAITTDKWVGRQFWIALTIALLAYGPLVLESRLQRLVDSGFSFERIVFFLPEVTIHVLIRLFLVSFGAPQIFCVAIGMGLAARSLLASARE